MVTSDHRIGDTEFAAAEHRALMQRSAVPAAVSARFDRRSKRIVVELASGVQLGFLAVSVQGLEHANPDGLAKIVISPSGLGLFFPSLDADVYLPALIEGVLGTKRWMAAEAGQLGGKAKTSRKAAASRRNGRLGGRPKKHVA